jgi:hypothetical protein
MSHSSHNRPAIEEEEQSQDDEYVSVVRLHEFMLVRTQVCLILF